MSNTTEQDVAFIEALAELLKKSDLTEIEVGRQYGDDDELNVRLSRATMAAPTVVAAPAAIQHVAPSAPAAGPSPDPAPAPAAKAAPNGPDLSNALTSPMVGTVYLAAEPDSPPFVSAGDTVQEGQTVLIIEAMKTMNQIAAPRTGRVKAVLVENAEPVEFGEPLLIIE